MLLEGVEVLADRAGEKRPAGASHTYRRLVVSPARQGRAGQGRAAQSGGSNRCCGATRVYRSERGKGRAEQPMGTDTALAESWERLWRFGLSARILREHCNCLAQLGQPELRDIDAVDVD